MSSGHLIAVIGAAVIGLVGAVAMIIYEKVQDSRRVAMTQDINVLTREVSTMKEELDRLKEVQREKERERLLSQKMNKHQQVKPSTSSEVPVIEVNGSEINIDSNNTYTTDTDRYSSARGTDFDHSSDDLSSDSDTESIGITKILATADRLLGGNDSDIPSAKRLLFNAIKTHKNHHQVLWRLGRLCHKLSKLTPEDELKQEWVVKGIEHCQKAIELNDSNSDSHKWYAVLVGCRAESLGVKEKIESGHVFKKHVDRALELNPSDCHLHHMLGMYKYVVSGLSWFERTLATNLFAEPPVSTYSEAISDFLTAEAFSKQPWKTNRLFLAKCYIGNRNYCNALDWLEQANEIPLSDVDDPNIEEEIEILLNKYACYKT